MLKVFLLYRFDSTPGHKAAIITMFHEVKENRQPINAIIISAEKLKQNKQKIDILQLLIHVVLWQKPTQNCKAIFFQLKIN